jgi:hypothetical protein
MACRGEGAGEDVSERTRRCVSERPEPVASLMARSVQGEGEHVSARTFRCVSERADPTTREWPAMSGAVVTGTTVTG